MVCFETEEDKQCLVWFSLVGVQCLDVQPRVHRPPRAGTRPVSGQTKQNSTCIIADKYSNDILVSFKKSSSSLPTFSFIPPPSMVRNIFCTCNANNQRNTKYRNLWREGCSTVIRDGGRLPTCSGSHWSSFSVVTT